MVDAKFHGHELEAYVLYHAFWLDPLVAICSYASSHSSSAGCIRKLRALVYKLAETT